MKTLNPKAEVMGRAGALFMTISAAKGLLDVMRTNLGPKGTIKMLVGGAGGEWPPAACAWHAAAPWTLHESWLTINNALLQTSSSQRTATCY